jgi:ABC-2 type transport system permease protein
VTDQIHHPLIELTVARFREFLREPEALFWAFAFPIIMTCALGVAFRAGSDATTLVGVADGPAGDATARALDQTGQFTVRRVAPEDVDRVIRDGRVPVVVIAGDPPMYRFDRARAESHAARLLVDAALQRAAGRRDAFQATESAVDAAGSRYIDWLVPGLIGMNVMSTGLWSVGFSIAQARMRKLLKRLVATPMSRAHYLGSHLLNRLLFLTVETTILVVFARWAFDVHVRGSHVALAVITLVGALCFGAMALLVSSRARTIEAISGLLNVVMLPMWVLSGVFFASSNFPDVMQPFIQALPLTALNNALRAVVNDGSSITALGRELGTLLAWAMGSFVIALKLFRWQ